MVCLSTRTTDTSSSPPRCIRMAGRETPFAKEAHVRAGRRRRFPAPTHRQLDRPSLEVEHGVRGIPLGENDLLLPVRVGRSSRAGLRQDALLDPAGCCVPSRPSVASGSPTSWLPSHRGFRAYVYAAQPVESVPL